MSDIQTPEAPRIDSSLMGEMRESRSQFVHEYLGLEEKAKEARSFNQAAKITEKFIHKVSKSVSREKGREGEENINEEQNLKEPGNAGDILKYIEIKRNQERLSRTDLDEGERAQLGDRLARLGSPELRREKIKEYLRASQGYFFHIVDKLHPLDGGISTSKFSKNALVEDSIINSVIDYVASEQGLTTVREPKESRPIRKILQVLIEHSKELRQFKDFDLNSGDPIRLVKKAEDEAVASLEVASLYPDTAMFAAREWRRQTIKGVVERGVKVYKTPYYDGIFRRCDQIGDKENGLGGKVFFGPPGTGKTEIAIYDAKERNGFEPRIVSMHYWSSFNNLVYETSVKVAGASDKQLSYQQRMLNGIDFFQKLDGADFYKTITEMVDDLKERGRIGADTSIADFLKPFLTNENYAKIAQGQGLESLSEEIKNGVIGGLKKHAAAATFGEVLTEEDFWEDIVKGEVLLAIENNQDRIVLDEGEKAGPYAWQGLARILAMSPGQELDIRGRKVQIPGNLRFDVTVNSLELDEYIKSRFNEIYVGYPPAKDEIMLSSVWLSDNQGNIQLTEEEQFQLAGFFTYIMPQFRQLYDQDVLGQPFDLRVTHELCNLLVDPTTKKRTDIKIERALNMILFEQRGFTQIKKSGHQFSDEQARKEEQNKAQLTAHQGLKEIMSSYRQVLIKQPVGFGEEEDKAIALEQRRLQDTQAREELSYYGLLGNLYSPLAGASSFLPDSVPQFREAGKAMLTGNLSLSRISFSDKQANDIKDWIRRKKQEEADLKRSDVASVKTETGFQIELSEKGDGIELLSVPVLDSSREILSSRLPEGISKIVSVTPDGSFILAKNNQQELMWVNCWNKRKEADCKKLSFNYSEQGKYALLAGGNGVVAFSKEGGLKVYPMTSGKEGEPFEFEFDSVVDDFEISRDSSILLIKSAGKTFLVNVQEMLEGGPDYPVTPSYQEEGSNWHVVSDSILFNTDSKQAFLVSKN